MPDQSGRGTTCRYCDHDTENADAVCGPCRTVAARGTETPREDADMTPDQAACAHTAWRFDDVGNHWCQECELWHESPHLPENDLADCATADDV